MILAASALFMIDFYPVYKKLMYDVRNFKQLFLSHFRRYWASFSIQNIPLFMAFKVLRFILVGAQSFRRGNAPEDDLSNFT